MSGIFKLGWRDLVKGLIIVVFAGVLTVVTQSIDSIPLFNDPMVKPIVIAVAAYLLKNLGTDENDKFLGKV